MWPIIAGAQPAVRRPLIRLFRHVVVGRCHPRAAHFDFADAGTVVRRLRAVEPSDARFDERRGDALLQAVRILFVSLQSFIKGVIANTWRAAKFQSCPTST